MLIVKEKQPIEEEDANVSPPPYLQATATPSTPPVAPSTPIAASPASPTSPTSPTLQAAPALPPQLGSQSAVILSHLQNTFITAPTNNVYISDTNNSVKGSWTIDGSLSPPPAFVAPINESERKNLFVRTRNGSLNVKVRFANSQEPVEERVTFHCSSQNGTVQVYILPRTEDQPSFHLKAQSTNGTVKVYLPRDFTGPIEHRVKGGTMTFSPGVRPHLTMFASTKEEGKSFLGDWQTSQLQEDGSSITTLSDWPGDHLDISTNNGNLCVQYVDEEKIEAAFVKTFKGLFGSSTEMKSLFGGMKDSFKNTRHF